ncbi:histidinol dehydrogenase [Natronospira bacteriovora]|uniref:Histidinol dehydrogenase n=1 Tax=Natronospira bacteriovora TaxID=3069753 RepID=A0ABU0W693_9GAMM|nr:histidinol dehydrogenase [Natronospira sp. AB-CW4]MDQ2069529.1 histidinol dehydrogenase [Natronospira sp. AB-CW4]
MSLINRLDSQAGDFESRFMALLDRDGDAAVQVDETVRRILRAVREEGDAALLRYTRELDRLDCAEAAELEIPAERLSTALEKAEPAASEALTFAAERIRAYAERQKEEGWSFQDAQGNRLGQRVTALDRVGVYVPGGRAAYPSSVLMNIVPARVAGVGEIIMVVPAPDGVLNDLVLAAAALTGVDRVFTVGGAQAVAALAYGTATLPAVDKIVGPGNAWVASAKRQVFGRVGIDSIAGPSEVAIYTDGSLPPDWAAMDLFAQAEHDELAQSILVSPDSDYLDRVEAAMERLLSAMPRRDIIRASLSGRGALIDCHNEAEGLALINRIAPEHLELAVDDPDALLPSVRHAGAIFMGHHAPEAFGDYCAGPNHVLPTSGTARFASPLGVQDFQKRSSLIQCHPDGVSALAEASVTLADAEGLTAHARSAALRRPGGDQSA